MSSTSSMLFTGNYTMIVADMVSAIIDFKEEANMKNACMMVLGMGMVASACAADPAELEAGDRGEEVQSLTAAGCSDGTDCAETAAFDDSFTVSTTNGCGSVEFVDFGPGAAGGGDNDDYVVIHDLCSDGHGVKAWAWLNGTLLGSQYNGNGLAGAPVIWDPFKSVGNVGAGDAIGLEVCLVDGNSDPTPSGCGSLTRTSRDG